MRYYIGDNKRKSPFKKGGSVPRKVTLISKYQAKRSDNIMQNQRVFIEARDSVALNRIHK